ncbi:MAG: PrsW family intramembrane metalloprotease [Paludibacteraceae bacterium]|nr:PrsW family intramembrane metalloprotease [Paludibacteraceae bacterium]
MNTIVILALLPSVILAWWIYRQDKLRKEPVTTLALAFVAGILSVVLVLILHSIFEASALSKAAQASPFVQAFVSAALVEESAKLFVFLMLIWNNEHFDERFDGIVYACYIGLGFAFLENISYFSMYDDLVGLFIGRALFSVPGHFLFGVLMGYFLGLAKFADNSAKQWGYVLAGLLMAVLAHGVYDYLLMKAESALRYDAGLSVLLNVGFYVFDFILWRVGLKRLHRMQAIDAANGFSRNASKPSRDEDWRQRPPVV